MILELPARFTGEPEDISVESYLELGPTKTASLIIDISWKLEGLDGGDEMRRVVKESIAPAVNVARDAGMRIVYIYCYPGGGIDGPDSIWEELHRARRGKDRKTNFWRRKIKPPWPAGGIELQPGDAMISKCPQNSFNGTMLDNYLRGWGVSTVLVTGFSFKSCVFYTMVGALERDYRAVLLRDGAHPLGMNGWRDTLDDFLPEKGWVRRVLTRLTEDHLGYPSTCDQLVTACIRAQGRAHKPINR